VDITQSTDGRINLGEFYIYKKKDKYIHDSHEGRGNLPSTAKTAAVNEASAPPKSPSVSRPINCEKEPVSTSE
jgi:hypothetical protein